MIRAWTPKDIRAAEQPLLDAGHGPPLMARAAAAVAAVCVRELDAGHVYGSRVAILAGKGNNGGDALYAGAHLARRGARVDVVLTADDAHQGGLAAARASGARIHRLDDRGASRAAELLRIADAVLDGIVGTGARPGLRSPVRELVANWTPARSERQIVIAVDMPSGIDVDTGEASDDCVRADCTVTFAGAKPGLLLPPAAGCAGNVEVVDIGVPLADETTATARLNPSDIAGRWPVPGPHDHKYTRGVLGIVAGSSGYPGAAVLATGGSRACGVGMIRYVGSDHVARAVNAAYPEVVPGNGRVQAWLFGPGIDPADDDRMSDVRRYLAEAGDTQLPCVLDAGALAAVEAADSAVQRTDPPMILTPHAGELVALMTRLGDTDVSRSAVEAAPAVWAQRAARRTDAVVVLKGPVTVIAQPHGPTYAQGEAPSWLATAGAGDVLAGIIGAITATSSETATGKSLPALAGYAALGVMTHGLAAGRASGGGPIAAGDIAAALPAVIADHLAGADRRPVGEHSTRGRAQR
ncbi:NAD(P)H-hydrate epimerase [Spelaeicoccus albus]|uniref:Bifunctional NAD(P)H-hydrate repair enzyme n=1 Tax=Spelaeicoccus albus TaxID=1280376 RepID=A0A7Z0D183_9MICO|nr:NAD(P)H-hydrate epimerase [Spelaeicoccus albus]NYI65802.1 hydroxyethylthiazole kinase-like uncharacterized protein yjeF [Spelaeicoccus albus]